MHNIEVFGAGFAAGAVLFSIFGAMLVAKAKAELNAVRAHLGTALDQLKKKL